MISNDHLRSSVAIAHRLDGVRLDLTLRDGQTVMVGAHPSADLHPCQVRRVLLAEAHHGTAACHRGVTSLDVGGSLAPIGPGLYRGAEGHRRCFATFLAPTTVESLLRTDSSTLPAPTEIDAAIKPDLRLGVTVVQLTDPAVESTALDDLVIRLGVICIAEEWARHVPGETSARPS